MESTVRQRVKWRKILYKRQPFSDEYSGGDEFLKELRTNIDVTEYSLLEAICGGCRVAVHCNAAVCFYLVFDSVRFWISGAADFLKILSAASLSLYVAFVYLTKPLLATLIDHAFTCITLSCFGFALTPIVRTLTDTISTDTIYLMWTILVLLSFIFHDYALNAPIVSTILSVNLSLAASVCLVSRVKSNEIAFGLLALSMFLFSYWPRIRNALFQKWPFCSLYMELLSSSAIYYYLQKVSLPVSILYLLVHFIVVFMCPLLFIRMQPLRSTKHGPWDEASTIYHQ